MKVEDAILILKDYVNVDIQMRQHRTESDFEQFCETTCIAIDTVINEIETYKEYFKGFKQGN